MIIYEVYNKNHSTLFDSKIAAENYLSIFEIPDGRCIRERIVIDRGIDCKHWEGATCRYYHYHNKNDNPDISWNKINISCPSESVPDNCPSRLEI